jgi:hypothetical protein
VGAVAATAPQILNGWVISDARMRLANTVMFSARSTFTSCSCSEAGSRSCYTKFGTTMTIYDKIWLFKQDKTITSTSNCLDFRLTIYLSRSVQ